MAGERSPDKDVCWCSWLANLSGSPQFTEFLPPVNEVIGH